MMAENFLIKTTSTGDDIFLHIKYVNKSSNGANLIDIEKLKETRFRHQGSANVPGNSYPGLKIIQAVPNWKISSLVQCLFHLNPNISFVKITLCNKKETVNKLYKVKTKDLETYLNNLKNELTTDQELKLAKQSFGKKIIYQKSQEMSFTKGEKFSSVSIKPLILNQNKLLFGFKIFHSFFSARALQS